MTKKIVGKALDDFEGHASGTGTGAQTVYVLPDSVKNLLNLRVELNGISQRPTTDYTISGSNLTFITAPADQEDIDVFYDKV